MEVESTDGANSFGIRKIVDCKLEEGIQMYRVEWQATWEPAESLVSCQHLIDEFWSHINNIKAKEKVAQEYRFSKQSLGHQTESQYSQITKDDKAAIQTLLTRTNSTPVGSVRTPSDLLSLTQISNDVPAPKEKPKASIKVEPSEGAGGGSGNVEHGLKYIENFSNPYVKIVVLCKICNKEQSLKFRSYWRMHYTTHERPHQCPHCEKKFRRPNEMRKHMQAKHGIPATASKKEDREGMDSVPQMDQLGQSYHETEDFF